MHNLLFYAEISTVYADYFQKFTGSGCTIRMVLPTGNIGTATAQRTTVRQQAPRRPGIDTGGRGRVSGTGGIGSCQGSRRSRSGSENNLTIPIPLPLPVIFSRLNISTVDLRGDISMALLFHVIPPFSYGSFLLRGLSSFRRAFFMQSHFSVITTVA